MCRLQQSFLPPFLLVLALSGGVASSARTYAKPRKGQEKAASKTDTPASAPRNQPAGASGLDTLCRNHYNALHLTVGKFEQVKAIIERDKKASVQELKNGLNAKNITLYEASWGLYYLGQKSLSNQDFPHFVQYLTVAADDYLNPWAMTLLAKVYFYDKAAWKKQFPQAQITTDKDLERSYTYLALAFVLSGEIEKDHQDNFLLTGVTNGGLAMRDTFEGTGISGFDARRALQKHQQDMLVKAETYKKMYEKGR